MGEHQLPEAARRAAGKSGIKSPGRRADAASTFALGVNADPRLKADAGFRALLAEAMRLEGLARRDWRYVEMANGARVAALARAAEIRAEPVVAFVDRPNGDPPPLREGVSLAPGDVVVHTDRVSR